MVKGHAIPIKYLLGLLLLRWYWYFLAQAKQKFQFEISMVMILNDDWSMVPFIPLFHVVFFYVM